MRASNRWLLPIVILLIVLLALQVLAQGTAGNDAMTGKKGTGETPKITFEKFTLPNGIDVMLHVDRKLPVVHVNQWFHVGSKNEKVGRTGFAHLFEHIMFQGSKNAPGEYFSYVEKAGANLAAGGVNGTTSMDRTNYFATVPSANLEYLLWLESDRLATLTDVLTKEKLDNQRDVVKNERRQGLENQPYGRASKLLTETLYPAGHPYSHDVIGIHEDLTAASLDDVSHFFRTYYTPNNLSLVIAGDFDPVEAKRLVEKYFGGIPVGPALDRIATWIPKLDGERIVEVKDRVSQERTYIAWPTPQYFAAGEAELDMAVTILIDGLSSRLQKALVYDRQLCSDVSGYNEAREISGNLILFATARPGTSLEQVESIITEEIARLAKSGPTAEELARAKTKWEYQFVTGLERIGGFGGKADRLNMYNVFLGDPDKFDEDLARYRGVTADGVKSMVAKWLDNRNRVIVRFRPEVATGSTTADIDRSAVPALGADSPFKAPDVASTKLDNGMEILLVQRPELPKVAVAVGMRAGAIADPAGKEGLAQLTAAVIDMGTKTRRALEISDQMGDLGVTLGAVASREDATVTLEALKRNLDPALAVAADIVRNPSFPADEVEREKKRTLDRLSQEESMPNALSWRVGSMLAFGREHPYGRPSGGTRSSVEGITRADLVNFHQTYWKPGNGVIVFVGNITMAEATEMARKHFGSWSGGSSPTVTIPEPKPAVAGKIYIIDRQNAPQTVVAQILPAPARKTSDYHALRLADAVWGGGGFGTRLNLNIREDKGYSYGVFSFPIQYAHAGLWRAGGGVQTDKTKEAIVEFVSELKGLAGARPITEKELATAKAVRMRGFSQEFETLGQITERVIDLWSVGLPMSELNRDAAELQVKTLSDVNEVARKYAVPDKSIFLLIGDRAKIEPGLRALNIGEVVVLDVEGRPIGEMGQR